MTKKISLKFFCPTLCYILLLTQTTVFYYKNQIQQQLQQNANQGSITITSAKDVNILASQNVIDNHSSYNETNMMYQIQDNHDLQVQTTVSPLLSSNNITINADGGNGNINLLSAIITGQGNLDLNGNVNMQSLQDLYYQYDFSQATSMNLGALLGMLLAAVVIGAVTGGAGALAMAAVGVGTAGAMAASFGAIGVMIAVATTAATAAVVAGIGVVAGIAISAAMDAKNGGYAATSEMQSGHMDSTTKQYQAMVGNSLLFGGNINTNVNNTSVDSATNISSNNMNQTGDNNESALFESKHETIDPNWSGLMTEAAIIGVISGVTVVGGDAFLGFAKETNGLKWLYSFDEFVKGSPLSFILGTHSLYPGVETLTRFGLEKGLSETTQ